MDRVELKAMDEELVREDKALIKKMQMKLRKAMNKYGLIEDGDHLLIGLSGGKDSLALVEFLGRQSQIHVPSFRLTAVHVSVENVGYESDLAYLEEHCRVWGVPFVHFVTRFDETVKPDGNICFPCAWFRRKGLFKVAEELGCNKIALGHHQDDIVETLLMNLVYQGTFSTMPPRLKMDKFDMVMVRPLCLMSEEELIRFAEIRKFKKQIRNCPHERNSQRNEMKELLAQLKKMNPNVCGSMWGAMENVKEQYLP